MSTQIALSIIVPVFNVEKYVETCISSLYLQDLPAAHYEIIVVDDCSPDRSMEIVRRLQVKHPDLRIIRHDRNKRQGAARNSGIRNAVGDYVLFVDSDDYLETNTLKQVVEFAENNHADVVCFDYFTQQNDGSFLPGTRLLQRDAAVPLTGIEEIKKHNLHCFNAWSRLYRRQYLLDNNLFFAENVVYEDVDFAVRAVFYAQRLCVFPQSIYYFVHNDQSTTNSVNGSKLADTVKLGSRLFSFSKKIAERDNELSQKYQESGIWTANQAMNGVLFLSRKERCAFARSLAGAEFDAIKNHLTGWRRLIVFHGQMANVALSLAHPFLLFARQLRKFHKL